ncbi:hypothetical protein ABZ348_30820 [Streptomyces sp. NPDC005963]
MCRAVDWVRGAFQWVRRTASKQAGAIMTITMVFACGLVVWLALLGTPS